MPSPSPAASVACPDTPDTTLVKEAIKREFGDHLRLRLARWPAVATTDDHYLALAYTVRDRLFPRWLATMRRQHEQCGRIVCYLSTEYLLGPHLGYHMGSLGIEAEVRAAMTDLGLDLDALLAAEPEPGLGAASSGQLAACYLDALATGQIPAIGYGLRYEYGLFKQVIVDGRQVERTDKWLRMPNPWEVPRPALVYEVKFGGYTQSYHDDHGRYRVNWLPQRIIKGVAFDTPIPGYRGDTVNLLRLWQAQAVETFDVRAFNQVDYYGAIDEKILAERLTKVLYPRDEPEAGKRLRLEQAYFLVSCALRDMIRRHLQQAPNLQEFHLQFAVQLNDSPPALAIPELQRLLVDEYLLAWDEAWTIVQRTFAYTCHTLLTENLETWSVELFGAVLPRHLEIVYELNRRFLDEVRRRYPDEPAKAMGLSLIGEGWDKHLRMAYLACLGSHAINGGSLAHTECLQQRVLPEFYALTPEKFSNKTHGISPRRFLGLTNPGLCALIDATIGPGWLTDSERLHDLGPLAEDRGFQEQWQAVRRDNKLRLAAIIAKECGVIINPDSLFDMQVSRFHEYQRPHLHILHILTHYYRLKRDPALDLAPRTFVFAGKAAPGYAMAKLLIRLIHAVAELVNDDPDVHDRLKLVFYPDFNVKRSAPIYAAADLGEQIALAGYDASGSGAMKFVCNGALIIGTPNGANVEIREAVGAENFFVFGMDALEVKRQWAEGYVPGDIYAGNEELRAVVDMLTSGLLAHGDCDLFRPIRDQLLGPDRYMLLADYCAYMYAQRRVGEAFVQPYRWARMGIYNVARFGPFSADRAIREYCRDIWRVTPLPVPMPSL